MDKFLTYPGKQPVYLGDINFMQSAARDAFQNLMKAYTGRADANAILYGVDITYAQNIISWTAGVVCIAGEILPIEAGTSSAGSPYYFDIVSTAGGQRTMGDGTTKSCWEERAATITSSVTDYPISIFKRISPVDTASARVHNFDGVVNLDDRYARLVNCGGAFMLSLRRPPLADAVATLFQGDVSDLTDGELAKFSASNAPSKMMAMCVIDAAGTEYAGNLYGEVEITWAIVSGKLQVTVSRTGTIISGISAPQEIHATLPVF